ncbi:inactive hydroxysteroid dehydrogenase-like protein 1 isoform X2 [Ruditapes philippinarum]|uniref:inactive hydroxysteroid dehydrogenase-like protein 1 isoform X2 n=1 Tax=Ruditapes philippinarum TaxID=129788 RepID=UPI00295B4A53|nr:inactive hydroxysteroid dehydrogenase-like protein 1 isoform X2 [Ruditapes philippinarum]
MAAIDRFEFLLREILEVFSDIKDAFAILGAIYAARKTFQLSATLFESVNVHLISRLSANCDLAEKFGSWAVVTGGSEGIGFAYAKELARRKLNIILISRSETKLKKAAAEIEEEFNVQTSCVAVDFSVGRDTYNLIWDSIKDKEIGVLVNNVGVMYDHPQYFLDVPEDRLWQIVNINVAAATMMTHMILPQMVKRGRGAVVVVSSGACSQITPQMTVYAGTKSFLDYFAQALRYEYKNNGIVIQSLRPFYVNTKMTRYSKTLTSNGFLVPSAEVYAKHAVATLGYSGRTTGYWPHTIQMWMSNLIPEWIWMWGASRLNTALRRQALERLDRKDKMKSSDSMNTLSEAKS